MSKFKERIASKELNEAYERIRELEAENAQLRLHWQREARNASRTDAALEQAEAEVAALKGRRCEDCGWEYCTTEDYSESWVDDLSLVDMSTDFYCARWKART